MRNLKTLLGIFVGITIVAGFAGTIQVANVFFSNAIYTRDAQETARRIDRDLNHHLLKNDKVSDEEIAAFADDSLRRSIDGVDGTRNAAAPAPARPIASPTANPATIDREASIAEKATRGTPSPPLRNGNETTLYECLASRTRCQARPRQTWRGTKQRERS